MSTSARATARDHRHSATLAQSSPAFWTQTQCASTFDEGDCVAACAALERDGKTKPNVEAHWVCVQKAGDDCAKVAECR